MNCQESEQFIMKYMDGEISKKEAEILNIHLSNCPLCKESFQTYDFILKEFEEIPLEEAPPNFESRVMAQIRQISEHEFQVQYSIQNKVWGHVWGAFTVIFGTGTIIAFYRAPIMNSLAQNPYFADKIQDLLPLEHKISEQGHTLQIMADEMFITANQTLSDSVGAILMILTVVCAIQYYSLRRRKQTDRMNHK